MKIKRDKHQFAHKDDAQFPKNKKHSKLENVEGGAKPMDHGTQAELHANIEERFKKRHNEQHPHLF